MGFTSFAGRVLFSSIFILAAWQKITDFGYDGGDALKVMEPKYSLFRKHVSSSLAFNIPDVELKYLLMAAIACEGIGGILFIFGISLGAYLLLIFLAAVTPIMHDFYNFDISNPQYVREFIQFLKNMAMFGALLFYLGMKNSKNLQKKPVKAKSS